MSDLSNKFAELIRKLLAAFRAVIDAKPDNQAELDRLKAEFAVERTDLLKQLEVAKDNDVDITELTAEIDAGLEYAGQATPPVQ